MNARKSRRGPIKAEDLEAELEADPEWVARRDEREREKARIESELRQAEAPLVRALRDAGFDVEWSWDLVNTSAPYAEALPILLEHLGRPYPDKVREGIARALAVRDAKFAWGRLVELYRREPVGTDAKDGLAVALAAASDDDVVGDVISLARDSTHGPSRLLLLRGLRRSRAPQARTALEEFADDPEIGEAARALLKQRRPRR